MSTRSGLQGNLANPDTVVEISVGHLLFSNEHPTDVVTGTIAITPSTETHPSSESVNFSSLSHRSAAVTTWNHPPSTLPGHIPLGGCSFAVRALVAEERSASRIRIDSTWPSRCLGIARPCPVATDSAAWRASRGSQRDTDCDGLFWV